MKLFTQFKEIKFINLSIGVLFNHLYSFSTAYKFYDLEANILLITLFLNKPQLICLLTIKFAQSALQRVIPPNECPGYDTKQSNGEVQVMLELWRIWSIPSLPLLLGLLWPRMVAPDVGQIELTAYLC